MVVVTTATTVLERNGPRVARRARTGRPLIRAPATTGLSGQPALPPQTALAWNAPPASSPPATTTLARTGRTLMQVNAMILLFTGGRLAPPPQTASALSAPTAPQ